MRADDTPVALIRPLPAARPARRTARLPRASSGRRRGPLRWAVRIVAVLVVLGLGYFAVSLFQVWSTGRTDQARTVDAIVVMGAAQYDGVPSPQLAARLDHVVDLWPQGLAPLVVATGGKRPGDRFTEAQASAAYLTDHGVPADAILLEDQGTSSYESLRGWPSCSTCAASTTCSSSRIRTTRCAAA
ncbi:MAG: YdcF family protein [Ilumatobacteraceae bacterium]